MGAREEGLRGNEKRNSHRMITKVRVEEKVKKGVNKSTSFGREVKEYKD